MLNYFIAMGTRLENISKCMEYKKDKENIQILQNQNKLQQDQILKLVHFLSLTTVQVREHKEAPYELDTRLLILKKTYGYQRIPMHT